MGGAKRYFRTNSSEESHAKTQSEDEDEFFRDARFWRVCFIGRGHISRVLYLGDVFWIWSGHFSAEITASANWEGWLLCAIDFVVAGRGPEI